MGGVGAPHQPAVVAVVTGFQADQAAGLGWDVHAAPGHGGLEHDRLADPARSRASRRTPRPGSGSHPCTVPKNSLPLTIAGGVSGLSSNSSSPPAVRAERPLPEDAGPIGDRRC